MQRISLSETVDLQYPLNYCSRMSKRLNLDISDDLHAYLTDLAVRRSTTMADLVRKGLAVIKAAERHAARGPVHMGFVSDPSRLDVEIVGVLD